MNLFTLTNLSVGISCLVLSGLIFYFGTTKLHRILLAFNLVVSVWGLGLFFAGISTTGPNALLGWKIAHLGGFCVAPIFYHLIIEFCSIHRPKILLVAYLQGLLFILISLGTDLLFQESWIVYNIHYLKGDTVYLLGVLLYFLFVLLSFYELARFLPAAKGHKRMQTLYIMFGFLVGFTGATFIFPPMFGINILYPFTNLGITFYCLILAYAMLRYRLMDFHIVFRKSLIYSLAAGLLTSLYLILVLLMTKLLSDVWGWTSFSITVTAALIIAFFFNPIKNTAQLLIDKLFYNSLYDNSTIIKKISSELLTSLELKPICNLIADTIFEGLQLEGIYLLSEEDGNFNITCFKTLESELSNKTNSLPAPIKKDSKLISILSVKKEALTNEEISQFCTPEQNKTIDEMLGYYKGKVLVPIFPENEPGFLLVLGKKLSGDAFSAEDLDLLNTVANQSAIALKNARLFTDLDSAYEVLARETKEKQKFANELHLSEELYRTLVDSAPF